MSSHVSSKVMIIIFCRLVEQINLLLPSRAKQLRQKLNFIQTRLLMIRWEIFVMYKLKLKGHIVLRDSGLSGRQWRPPCLWPGDGATGEPGAAAPIISKTWSQYGPALTLLYPILGLRFCICLWRIRSRYFLTCFLNSTHSNHQSIDQIN